ncbi:MAG: uroporphyrinogen-III C-methyltransferase, partial [bacterium]
MNEARIYLIGAGPGDPALLTLKGHRYLTTADVVVYDHLVHQRMLRWVRADAETIDVGAAAPRPLEQDAICLLLTEKAREGKTVARLKWGDPFVFDSRGKEALFLHEQGVPFEVVPGIPPGIGSPTYAGIPVTYPEAGDTLTLVRGHEGETDAPPKVAWSHLARVSGTIVTYGAGPQLAAMVKALRRHGRADSEPAAVIYRGTLPTQHTVQGSLAEIDELVSGPDQREAAILVVGRVIGLRDHLRWFDTRPLFGRQIVVTRPRAQASDLVDRLEQLGANAVEVPTIQIEDPDDLAPLDDACDRVDTFDW